MNYSKIINGNSQEVENIVNVLKSGKIVVLPTDTVYGIAVDATNKESVEKLYEVKKRDKSKALNILVSSKEMASLCTIELNEIAKKLIDKFWPGALTLVLEKNEYISKAVTANKNTIGIRMPNNALTLDIIRKLGRPIACPSANISNKPSGTNIVDIKEDFKQNVDLYVDDGESSIGIESTIVRVYDNYIKILREGCITKEEIIKKTNIKIYDEEIDEKKSYFIGSDIIFVSNTNDVNCLIEKNINKKIAIIGFDSFINAITLSTKIDNVVFFNLGNELNCKFANKNIYKYLRNIERKKFDMCMIERFNITNENRNIINILNKINSAKL